MSDPRAAETNGQPPGSAGSMRDMAQLTRRSQPVQPVGTPIIPDGLGVTLVPTDAIDAEQACAIAIAAYLRSLTFYVNNREGIAHPAGPPKPFQFEDVFDEWPDPTQPVPYPCASVGTADVAYEAHSLVPTPLEGTFGLYDVPGAMRGTALWKTAEIAPEFQIDVWTRDIAKREAVIARMSSAFAPVEGVARVMLTGPSAYWNLPIRAQLLGVRRVDEPEPVYSHERRAIVRVRASVDVVDLRCATLLDVGYRLTLGTGAYLDALAAGETE